MLLRGQPDGSWTLVKSNPEQSNPGRSERGQVGIEHSEVRNLNWFDMKRDEYEFKYVHERYDHVISHMTNIVSNIQKLEHGILNICSQQSKIATSITDKNFKKLNVTLMNIEKNA